MKRRGKGLTDDQINHIIKNKGIISASKLAAHHGCSLNGIYSVYKRYGLTKTSYREPKVVHTPKPIYERSASEYSNVRRREDSLNEYLNTPICKR